MNCYLLGILPKPRLDHSFTNPYVASLVAHPAMNITGKYRRRMNGTSPTAKSTAADGDAADAGDSSNNKTAVTTDPTFTIVRFVAPFETLVYGVLGETNHLLCLPNESSCSEEIIYKKYLALYDRKIQFPPTAPGEVSCTCFPTLLSLASFQPINTIKQYKQQYIALYTSQTNSTVNNKTTKAGRANICI